MHRGITPACRLPLAIMAAAVLPSCAQKSPDAAKSQSSPKHQASPGSDPLGALPDRERRAYGDSIVKAVASADLNALNALVD
jgi:hypothetical protein